MLLYFGAESVEHFSRQLFKTTDCGMFADEPTDRDGAAGIGLVVGSIVEGADPVIVRKFRFPVTLTEWEQAMGDVEAWAAAEWHEAHCEERLGCGCSPDALHGSRDDIPMDAEVGGGGGGGETYTLPPGSGWAMRGDY